MNNSDDVVEDVVQYGDKGDSTEADLKAQSTHGTPSEGADNLRHATTCTVTGIETPKVTTDAQPKSNPIDIPFLVE